MMRKVAAILFVLGGTVSAGYADETLNPAEAEFVKLHEAYIAKYKPAWLKAQAARWEAISSGKPEAYERYKESRIALLQLHHDSEVFSRLEALSAGGEVTNPVRRQLLSVMHRAFQPAQGELYMRKTIIALETEIERIFHTHRSKVGDKMLTVDGVREILRTTHDSSTAEEAWKAYMAVGGKVDPKFRELVELRNAQAMEAGYESFFHMSMPFQDIAKKGYFMLFNRLYLQTRDRYAQLKKEIDGERAAHFGIAESELRPWHFGDLFFEGLPGRADADFDAFFKGVDLVEAGRDYFASFGLPCDDILAHSDLKSRGGKFPYPMSLDLNREGDVRVLCDLTPQVYAADTLLHELAQGVYSKNIRDEVPFLLRTTPHGILSEGLGRMLTTMVRHEDWLINVRKMEPAEAVRVAASARDRLRKDRLLYSGWAQVVVRFEHGIYAKPERNFSEFWAELRKTHQLLDAPERAGQPDYAAQLHIATMPMYYHSIPMGEFLAAQLRRQLAKEVVKVDDPLKVSFYNHAEAGKWLREKIIGFGHLQSWNALIMRSLGESLKADAFMEQYVGKEPSPQASPPRPPAP